MGLYMNKIFRLCAAGMLAVAFYGCDSSDSAKPVAPEDEKAQTDAESKDDPKTESGTDQKEGDSSEVKDGEQSETKEDTKENTDSKDSTSVETEQGSSKAESIDPDSTQSEDIKALEVVIRDFAAGYPDFENFQSYAYESQTQDDNFDTWTYPGYADNADWLERRAIPSGYDTYGCGNSTTPQYGIPVGANAHPHDLSSTTGARLSTPDYINAVLDQSSYVWYGEFGMCNGQQRGSMRGFAHELCSDAAASWTDTDEGRRCDKVCNSYIWAQKVYITPGMVKQTLSFAKSEDGKLNLREPVITKARNACDNKYFEQWFTDNELNKRSEGTLALKPSETSSAKGLWYDWNNGGFYPLDSVDASTGYWVISNPQFQNQFGPQSLTINCPPYKYMYAGTQTERSGAASAQECQLWLMEGGPRVGEAALYATQSAVGMRNFRNSGFTMVGYAPFKYKKGAGKVLEFTSLADMWVFVDGVMVLDLGGSDLAKQGVVDLELLAKNGHGCHADEPLQAYCEGKVEDGGAWKDDTWHHLHIFYADRHSNGSVLYLNF